MRKGDETKREILRAAEQLFCQKGYEAASMQEIVRAAGVSKGGIYHHFASKEEIMTLLSHQHAQESAERAEAQLADAPDDLARLNLLLSACLPMRDEDAAFTAMLLPMATSCFSKNCFWLRYCRACVKKSRTGDSFVQAMRSASGSLS